MVHAVLLKIIFMPDLNRFVNASRYPSAVKTLLVQMSVEAEPGKQRSDYSINNFYVSFPLTFHLVLFTLVQFKQFPEPVVQLSML